MMQAKSNAIESGPQFFIQKGPVFRARAFCRYWRNSGRATPSLRHAASGILILIDAAFSR